MLLTIVSPTLNAARFLPLMLASVEKMEPNEVEHIVVDGGSTDGTASLASASGCRVIPAPGTSMYEAINVGISAAGGDVILCLNADDEINPGAWSRVQRTFQRSPEVSWVVGGVEYIDAQGRHLGVTYPPHLLWRRGIAGLAWNPVPHPAIYCRTELVQRLRGYDETLEQAADYDFVLRALADSKPATLLGNPLARFRLHGSNLSRNVSIHDREREAVKARHAPCSLLTDIAGQIVRFDLNLRSPRTAIRKLLRRIDF